MGELTKSVDGADSLLAALSTAEAGTIIELEPGDYGHLGINVTWNHPWGKFDGEVTIRSADPNNPATFSSMFLLGVENLTIDDVVVDYTTPGGMTAQQREEDKAIQVRESTNVTIRNSVIDGDVLDEPGSPRDGLPTGGALSVKYGDHIVIEDNEFRNWRNAGSFSSSSDIVVSGNEFHTLRVDGATFVAVQGVVIEDNYFHDFVTKDGLSDHRDMVQFWTTGSDEPSTDIVIRDNFFDSGSGPWTQSIFMRNEVVDSGQAGQGMYYRNVLIENNVIYNAHLHGILVGEADGLTISKNTLLHNSDPGSGLEGNVSQPSIKVADGARNVVIKDNIADEVPTPAHSSWNVSHNLIVQYTDPAQPNYYGDLFINALTGGADLAALQALPGSVVEKGGYGSSLTRFDSSPEALTAIIHFGGETANDTFSFDGGYTANGQGPVGDGDATFRWDMDDGTVLEGAEITHAFAPGTYGVTLTVTDAAGNTDSALSTIHVPEPVRLALDVTAQGLVDHSSYGVSGLPSAKIEQDGGRYAARLSDNTGFGLERGAAPIHDLDAFTVSLDLRAVSGAASAGEILRLQGSMVLRVETDGSFVFDFTNVDDEDFQLRSAPTKALDGNWHDVSVSYDTWSGVLALYVDGDQAGIASASGATKPEQSWGLHFGSIWGSTGFDGLVDDVEIRDDALPGTGDGPGDGPGGGSGGGSGDGPVVVSPENPVELPQEPEGQVPEPAPDPAPEPAPEPAPQPEPGDLSFDLAIAYDDGQLIDADLTDGEVLALDDVDDGRVTLVATPSAGVGSVRMELVGISETVENVAPYVLFGDDDGNYNAGETLGAGDYGLVLTAYSGGGGGGGVLGSETISFSIADQPAAANPDGVYRWNAGPGTVAAVDGGPDWVADTGAIVGSAQVATSPIAASGTLDASVPGTTPKGIFAHEYWGDSEAAGMGLEFGDGTLEDGTYAVRLYMGNGWSGTNDPGERVFDVSVEDEPFLDDLDLSGTLGHRTGGMFEWQGTVDDGTIDIDFLHGVDNPLINAVEIIPLDDL